jgi:hypothetical protein
MAANTFEPGNWYIYQNGDIIKTFFCVTIDGEYLLYNDTQGFSLIQCRPATEEEIEKAKKEL